MRITRCVRVCVRACVCVVWGGGCLVITLSSDAAGKRDVPWHDGDALGVDGGKVDVLKKANKVRLGRLLQGADGRGLDAKFGRAGGIR